MSVQDASTGRVAVIGVVVLAVCAFGTGALLDVLTPNPQVEHVAQVMQLAGPLLLGLLALAQVRRNGAQSEANAANLAAQGHAMRAHGAALDAVQASMLASDLHAHRAAVERSHGAMSAAQTEILAQLAELRAAVVPPRDDGGH